MPGFFRRLADPAGAADNIRLRPLTTTYGRSLDLMDDESSSVRVQDDALGWLDRNGASRERGSRPFVAPTQPSSFELAARVDNPSRPLEEVEEPAVARRSSGQRPARPSDGDAPALAAPLAAGRRPRVADTNVGEEQRSPRDRSSLGSRSTPPLHERPSTAKGEAQSARFVAAVREQPPPDVHIHIGRIELTAAPAPVASPRRKPTVPPPAMPLDEYLRRRNGKGR